MLKKEERFVKSQVVSEVLCNICGKKINPEAEDFVHIEKRWGYFSKKDGDYQQSHICESCWDSLCGGFKIGPEE